MKRSPYDWPKLKTEYITGEEPVLTKFFVKKKIPEGTWGKHVNG